MANLITYINLPSNCTNLMGKKMMGKPWEAMDLINPNRGMIQSGINGLNKYVI